MGWLALIVAFLCGVALLINLDTGDLKENQVIGIAILALVVAIAAGLPIPNIFKRTE